MTSTNPPVPFVDLGWQHRHVAEEVAAGFASVMEATSFIDGPDVARFETMFADFVGAAYCVGVANGTDAIELALRAAGIGAGSRVVLPANTFIATAEAVARAGAVPVLVDCDDEHLLIDTDAAAEAIEGGVRAVIGVHLYGQMAPLDRLVDVATESGVLLFEDAAQAQGATRNGAAIGSLGVAAATSFYPGKNLGAYGDAGAVVTSDPGIAEVLRALRNHGSARRYYHDHLGMNARLDTLQAVVLAAKLPHLEEWNRLRRDAADRYASLLADVEGVRLPSVMEGNEHVWHLYVVGIDPDVAPRDEVLARLQASGVGAAIHYPVPVHLHGGFDWLGHRPGSFPVAEAAAGRILSLPMFPGITEAQQEQVAESLLAALGVRV